MDNEEIVKMKKSIIDSWRYRIFKGYIVKKYENASFINKNNSSAVLAKIRISLEGLKSGYETSLTIKIPVVSYYDKVKHEYPALDVVEKNGMYIDKYDGAVVEIFEEEVICNMSENIFIFMQAILDDKIERYQSVAENMFTTYCETGIIYYTIRCKDCVVMDTSGGAMKFGGSMADEVSSYISNPNSTEIHTGKYDSLNRPKILYKIDEYK